ncbi:hypothetical protein psal_cds_551 [Pandoravirus salinus]|uniref:Ankyrin repeat domain containing protein n=1 Tax=Pandoravirus salinus TaxID=1349410 RepID=S4W2I0_9VIRU|nr:hypothetical protein psal_cds_551 [Pandoravirus salinus]AGO84395.1 hypothetical protein psal_cds_551 [Pandoravirus salinus]
MARARLAHRCLAVQESDRTRASRQEAIWLRTSPEHARVLGRTDVITYLYARKRIARTIDLTTAALCTKNVDMVRLVRQKCPLWNDTSALIESLGVSDPSLFYRLLPECTGAALDRVAEQAVRMRRTDVIDWLVETNPSGWCTAAVFTEAVMYGNVSVVRFVSATTGLHGDRQQDAFRRAVARDSLQVARFLFDLGGCYVARSMVEWAQRSPSTTRLLLSLPGLDMEEAMYEPRVTIRVVRLLCEACPHFSRQRLLDGTESADVAQYVCEIDSHVDLQQGLDAAADAGRFDVVRFLCTKDASIEPAIQRHKVAGHLQIVDALYVIQQECASDKERPADAPS